MADILMLHPDEWHSFHHEMYANIHSQIASLYTIQEAQTRSEALCALSSPQKPKAVLLVHGELFNPEYRQLIDRVVSYAKNGGTVIMCLNFASFLHFTEFEPTFNQKFGLSWELGGYTRETYALNNVFRNYFNIPLQAAYSQKALHIKKTSQQCQVYVETKERMREMPSSYIPQSPVIFERYTDTGFIGYIGDVNNEVGSQAVLLGMLDKAINKSTHHPPSNGAQAPPANGFAPLTSPTIVTGRIINTGINVSGTSVSDVGDDDKVTRKSIDSTSSAPIQIQPSRNENSFDICSVCSKSDQLKQCAGCNTTKYCSRKCQQSAWPSHKLTCTGKKPVSQTSASGLKSTGGSVATETSTSVPVPSATTDPSATGTQPPPKNDNKCSVCQKTGPLKACAKCPTVKYCSVECQTSDWSKHKDTCAGRRKKPVPETSNPGPPPFTTFASFTPGSNSTQISNLTSDNALGKIMLNEGDLGLFVNQSRTEIFRRLIDLYRLRVDDSLVWDGLSIGINENRSSNQTRNQLPITHFKTYLEKSKRCNGFLPNWWNDQAKEECIKIACDPNGRSYIGQTTQKSDIQQAYNDQTMPMVMRMQGEKIFGSRIGHQ